MLSSGYAHKHNNEEGEPVTKERYILRLMVLIFTVILRILIRVLLGTVRADLGGHLKYS